LNGPKRNPTAGKYLRAAFDGKLGSAGLFGLLAIVAVALVLAGPSYPSVIYGPTTTITFSLSPKSMQLTTALASVISALAYCALAPWSLRSLNRSLILAHFVLLAMGFFMLTMASMSFASALSYAGQKDPTIYIVWHSRVMLIGFMSVVLGCLAFVMNLGITAIKSLRKRRKPPSAHTT
jgi:hypothetical protein